MKELLNGILTSIGAIIVFTPMIIVGILFNLVYPIYMSWQDRNPLTFLKIWWRLIDGTAATIGNMLYEAIAIGWDIMANVWGEWIEDGVAIDEKTKFGEKNITVSAAFGYIEHEKIFLYKRGKIVSKMLNFVFRENSHAHGSWLKYLAYKDIEAMDLREKK